MLLLSGLLLLHGIDKMIHGIEPIAGMLAARGEVVVVEDRFGVTMTEIIKTETTA